MAHVPTAATVGPVTDDLGVIRIAKGAPIQIGAYWVLSGADTALGLDEKRGVEIAFKELGGKVLGHPLKLNAEDDGCNAEGGQTAATKLAANPQTVIVLGPGLLVGRDARCADPVAAGHRQYLHRLHRARADGIRPQAGIRRLRPYRVQRQRAGQGRCHLCARRRQGAVGGHHPRRQPVRAAASAGVRRQLQAAGRQGAVAGGDRADRRRHESAADTHRQREARPDLLPGVHRRRRADRAPGQGARRAWRRPR